MSDKQRDKLQRIRGLLMNCAGWDGDEVASDRERAHKYYFQRPRGDEVVGRSNVVDGSLSAMVEANLAQMLDAFTNSNVATFKSNGQDDDDQAALETAVVTDVVMDDNNGYWELAAAIKDGLLVRNGVVKVQVETEQQSEVIEVANATPEGIAELAGPAVEVEVLSWEPNEDKIGDATIRVTATIRDFTLSAIPMENFLYPKDWTKLDLQRVPFCAERHVEARSELLRRGFPKKKVMMLKEHTTDFKIDSQVRNIRAYSNTKNAIDRLAEEVEWFECYVLVEGKGGSVERRRISVAGQSLTSQLEDVPVSHVPYAAGTPFVNPHRFTGISLFDKLRQTQDINTGLYRAVLDNANAAIRNGRAYLDGAVNEQDLSDGRPNKDIRVRRSVGDVRQAIMSFDQPDLSGGLLNLLEYQRQNRTELGGASLELASGQMQMAGGRIGSEGVDRAFSVMEQLASHMTKNMATSLIRNTWLVAHMVIRENYDTPVNVYTAGRWETPTPSEWLPRRKVAVKVGMSPGERARLVAATGKVLDVQLMLAEKDMDDVLVNAGGFYKTLLDWCRANDLEVPEQYWLDPTAEPQVKALQGKQQAAQAQADEQRALMGQAVGLEQLDKAMQKYKTDLEYTFKTWAETLHAEIEEAKIVGTATADLIAATKGLRSEPAGVKPNGQDPEPDTADSAASDSAAS